MVMSLQAQKREPTPRYKTLKNRFGSETEQIQRSHPEKTPLEEVTLCTGCPVVTGFLLGCPRGNRDLELGTKSGPL